MSAVDLWTPPSCKENRLDGAVGCCHLSGLHSGVAALSLYGSSRTGSKSPICGRPPSCKENRLDGAVGCCHLSGLHSRVAALSLYGSSRTGSKSPKSVLLLAWLQTWDEPLVSLPEIYQRGPGAIRDAKSARALVRVLEDHGHLVAATAAARSGANIAARLRPRSSCPSREQSPSARPAPIRRPSGCW
jgi:hypothetical protein